MSSPFVYLILGGKGSGQFQIVSDLIDFGANKEDTSLALHSSGDAADAEADFKVRSREAVLSTYSWSEGRLDIAIEGQPDLVFVVADGLADPADFVEAFHGWLSKSACTLGRIMTVVNCGLAIGHHEAFSWYDCCIHFSDVVLLAGRENVTNKQVQDFLDRYEKECYPCLFEYVKKGRVSNPSLLLEGPPRRISVIFDEPEAIVDLEDEEEDESDLAEEEAEAVVPGDIGKDPYLKRIVAGGRRERRLPDMAQMLKD